MRCSHVWHWRRSSKGVHLASGSSRLHFLSGMPLNVLTTSMEMLSARDELRGEILLDLCSRSCSEAHPMLAEATALKVRVLRTAILGPTSID